MTDLEQCGVCGTEVRNGTVIELTIEEKILIGPTAPDSVIYCKGCWRVCNNLQQGGQLLKGLYENALRKSGVPEAGERAQLFHKKLLAAATRKMQ